MLERWGTSSGIVRKQNGDNKNDYKELDYPDRLAIQDKSSKPCTSKIQTDNNFRIIVENISSEVSSQVDQF